MKPMLSQEISLDRLLAILEDDNYALSTKLDGERCLVDVSDKLVAYNRKGTQMELSAYLRDALLRPAWSTTGLWYVVDGELMPSGNLILFDLAGVHAGSTYACENEPYQTRYKALVALRDHLWSYRGCPVKVLDHSLTHEDKASLMMSVLEREVEGVEGVVARHLNGSYKFGSRSSCSLKWKHYKTVDCVVMGRGHDDKDNLIVGVYDGAKLTEIGRVSAQQADGPQINVGDVIEVTYLYFTGRLYQPKLPRLRKDKLPEECTMHQLVKVKPHTVEN
jgi:ATP-dependent DNA ligase